MVGMSKVVVSIDSPIIKNISNLQMFMISLILILSVVYLSHGSPLLNAPCPKLADVCLTKECVHAAARIDSSIDYKTHPCDDFYQFACGGWLKDHDIRKDEFIINTFIFRKEKIDRIVKDLLKEEIKVQELASIKKAKAIYASCMNKSLLEKLGLEPLKKIVTEEFGGWPLATEFWNESEFDLVTTLTKLTKYGITSFFKLSVNTIKKNNQRVLTISEPKLCLKRWDYLAGRQSNHLKALENDVNKIGSLFGLCDETTAGDEVRTLVDFEFELAKIMTSSWLGKREILTLKELQRNYSQAFNWTKLFSSILSSPGVAVNDVTGNEFILNNLANLKKLEELIVKTPKRTIANYLVWKFIDWCLFEGYVGGEVMKVYTYNSIVRATHQDAHETCLSYTYDLFGLAIDRMFVRRETLDDETRVLISKMIKRLKAVYDRMFETLDWMDDKTKMLAREKIAFMKSIIGYQTEVDNDTYLESLHRQLAFNKDTFLENILTIKKENINNEFRNLRTTFRATQSSAMYTLNKNIFGIPVGTFMSPFFNKKEPMSLIFGTVGCIIAHEIAHGLDHRGGHYDKFGNYGSWWSTSAEEKFKQKAQCLVDQYNNFTNEFNISINGQKTLLENFADNVAVKQAYKAYRRWVEGKEEPLLPSLPFTHDQLFFISYAQGFCEKSTESVSHFWSKDRVHAEARYRVNGPYQNSEEFAEAFQCPQCSYMNPIDKCGF